MEEEFSVDPSQLLEAASIFANQQGALSDVSDQEFLNRFHLPAIISALQTNAYYPGLESALVDCLERIFRTKYGESLIPHYMILKKPDSKKSETVGLYSNKRIVAQLVLQHGVYPLLLGCLIDGDEQVAAATTHAIKNLAGHLEDLGIVFPENVNESTRFESLAEKCSKFF